MMYIDVLCRLWKSKIEEFKVVKKQKKGNHSAKLSLDMLLDPD